MLTRILTPEERDAIEEFLAADGENEHLARNIAYRTKRRLTQIEADLALMKKLLARYDKSEGG